MMTKYRFFLLVCLPVLCLFTAHSWSQSGEVYLVLGSDTAIWDGMNVARYHCTYNLNLYTDPAGNAYQVMNPAFRARFVDSYGQPLKMTWWMMAGNIFRHATNKNVPLPNIMTLHLMKKYHGKNIEQNGDELSLHYHTFAWTDYDGDGTYWWNQALSFLECLDDFNYTLAQFLLEENSFPVSFRSGWHYMDNDWQHYLDRLLPYSLHNDHPNVRTDTSEPLDNTYDWSRAPAAFVPFRPSPENYQIPGAGPGWNVRSAHFNTVRYRNLMDTIFVKASQGTDQVACLWGHLPETDFLQNIEIIDSLAHKLARRYPEVKFHYCTAVEAMQRWRKCSDFESPQVIFRDMTTSDQVFFSIDTNEPIFQRTPFVAIKDIYERYVVVSCEEVGTNRWRTTTPFQRSQLAKAGVVVCDTMGNQTTGFINFLPDDIYVDNRDEGYAELSGSWSTSSISAWGIDSRIATIAPHDSAIVKWRASLEQPGNYNIFVQVPPVQNPATNILFTILNQQQVVDSVRFAKPLPTMDWLYLGTFFLNASGVLEIEMKVMGDTQSPKTIAADVVKISALVRDRDLHVSPGFIDLGPVSMEDTVSFEITITNRGVGELRVLGISSKQQTLLSPTQFPVVISGMKSQSLPVQFHSSALGRIIDTLLIASDDPVRPQIGIPVTADIQTYFDIVDNEDQARYQELGTWHYSNAQAYGPTSRYAYLNQRPGANARFTTTVKKSGVYDIFEIVPTTANAANRALYEIKLANVTVDSISIDQNQGSGDWVWLGRYRLHAGISIEVKVSDTGKSTTGAVLRADAIKIALYQEITAVKEFAASAIPGDFLLLQNYPNPFTPLDNLVRQAKGRGTVLSSGINPATTIEYQIPRATQVQLVIFDAMGKRVRGLVETWQHPGKYRITWDACDDAGMPVAAGVYFYRMAAGNYVNRKKMILLR
ncbi:MAG: hypothetical protein ONB44_25110 [candidate division KSB1 bacterium]|nr:hypothetical protein [candidate division KSB1 bacterium]